MDYCLVCWGDKEPVKTAPRKYCLKCSKDVRRKLDRQRHRKHYKFETKQLIRQRALNYYYNNRLKVLDYKRQKYRQKIELSLGLDNNGR